MKLMDDKFKMDQRKYLFTQQIIKLLNLPPGDAVMALSIYSFKRRLDKFMKDRSVYGY